MPNMCEWTAYWLEVCGIFMLKLMHINRNINHKFEATEVTMIKELNYGDWCKNIKMSENSTDSYAVFTLVYIQIISMYRFPSFICCR